MSRGELTPETLRALDQMVYQAIDLDPNKLLIEKIHGRQDIWPNFPKGTEYYHSKILGDNESDEGILADIFKSRSQGDLWIVEHDRENWARIPGEAEEKPVSCLERTEIQKVGEKRALRLCGFLETLVRVQETRNY